MSVFDFTALEPETFLIVCPLIFLSALLDAVAGGGALISIPAYMLAGLPIHAAIATNKLSASFGATMSAAHFVKNGLIDFRFGIPSAVFSVLGSILGARLSLYTDEALMTGILLIILPLTAFVILNRSLFHDSPEIKLNIDRRTFIVLMAVSFALGFYDGFFGPGAGTFTIICFTVFGKMSFKNANAQTKFINLGSTLSALFVFLRKGQVIIPLGLAAGLCGLLGSRIGVGLVLKNGSRITRPAIMLVLLLLLIKITIQSA